MFHPHGDGELVRQVLGHNPIRDFGTLPAIKLEDHLTAVHQQSCGPVRGSTGGRQEVDDARGGSCRGQGTERTKSHPSWGQWPHLLYSAARSGLTTFDP